MDKKMVPALFAILIVATIALKLDIARADFDTKIVSLTLSGTGADAMGSLLSRR